MRIRLERWLAATLMLVSISAFAQDDLIDRVNIEYDLFTLDNGLTTIVHTDRSTPTI